VFVATQLPETCFSMTQPQFTWRAVVATWPHAPRFTSSSMSTAPGVAAYAPESDAVNSARTRMWFQPPWRRET
jgi:hypothetical protein